ncbi:hypothetical protein AMECASPLE_033465, partial [Ameca splendens]
KSFLASISALWHIIIVSVGLAALSITVVTINIWTRTKDLWTIIAAAAGSVLLVTVVAAAIRYRKTKGNTTRMNKNT